MPAAPVTSERAAVARLAVPLVGQQLGLQLMGAVDVALVGRYSPEALAAVGVANALIFTISCVGMGVVMGLDAIAPQALGAGRPDVARRALRDALQIAVWLGAGLTLVVMASPALLGLAGVAPDVADEARVFVWARAPGVIPFLIQVAWRSYLSAYGRTRALVIAVVLGNVVNLVADYVLIFGDASLVRLGLPEVGLPPMGVLGAAIATSSVQLCTLLIYAAALRALHADAATAPTSSTSTLPAMLRVGVPIGLQLLAEVGVFALTGVLAAQLGTVAASGHNIAITIASFTFSLAIGIGSATAVRVGLAVGAGDPARARRAGAAGLTLGAALMSSTALVFVVAPDLLARLFTDDATIVAATTPLIRIAAVFQLSDGAQAIAAGALRGAGDTRAALWANVIGHYGLGLGVSLGLAFGADLGARGLWWGLSAGLTLTALVLLGRFFYKTRVTAGPLTAA
ncbi:MAG: MATE family efflux transporter [Kofleriaceae bacterium]